MKTLGICDSKISKSCDGTKPIYAKEKCKLCWSIDWYRKNRSWWEKYYNENKEKLKDKVKLYRINNHEKFLEERRKYRIKYKEKIRDKRFKDVYGITLKGYQTMLFNQKGMCAICFTKKSGYKHNYFCIDHDHNNNEIRGLLCRKCNIALGLFKENKEILIRGVNYLTKKNFKGKDILVL